MKKFRNIALALAAAFVTTSAPAVAATATHGPAAVVASEWNQGWNGDRWEGRRDRDYRDYRNDGRRDRYYGRGNDRGYYRGNDRGYYGDPVYRNTRVWRGNDGRNYCRRSNGTTGLLIGGAAGALLGREVAGNYGDRTLGAILGAAGGALLGREVDNGGSRCR
ncbi:hypothetical protein GGQ88_000407 [Novosphingobium hassiacum]|uniref:17 kDa surface antigen n=1 Tax=Novosphingobium hassiacum TaxID=173676 RepID=A0A7W5ZTH3_9SPHN|nr:glycine zipper 2TM domain-containing protein [Novosphingobium hassiacum]MBB3859167.1 hypothetical protein [Novosphingobium hassiacum]